VVLIGDSIRLGYAPRVIERLRGRAVVVSPPANGGDSSNVLAHLDEWVLRQQPDVVHLNCGLHDLKRSRADGGHQVEVDRYAENLRRIVARIRGETPRSSSPARRPSATSGTRGGGRTSIGSRPTSAGITPPPRRS
jgi:hypothetical protein